MPPLHLKHQRSDPTELTWSARVRDWSEIRHNLRRTLSLPTPVEIHLVRHGETETNAKGLVTGVQDVALTPEGKEQASRLGRALAPHYDLAFHSDLSRSRNTLYLAQESGRVTLGQVIEDSRLRERSLGIFELEPWQPIEEYARGDLSYAPEGGESFLLVTQRTLSFLLDLVDLKGSMSFDKVLVCGHMGPMRILVGVLEEQACSREVLQQFFSNTEVIRLSWHRLVFPLFLQDSF